MSFLEKLINSWSHTTIRTAYTVLMVVVMFMISINAKDVLIDKVLSNDACLWRNVPNKRMLCISDVIENGPAGKARIRNFDTLLAINDIPTEVDYQAQNILNSLPSGSLAKYRIKRGDVIFETHVKIEKQTDIQYLSLLLLGVGFCMVASIVLWVNPKAMISIYFTNYSIATALLLGFSHLNFVNSQFTYRDWLIFCGYVIGQIIYIPTAVRFFTTFPVRLRTNKYLFPILYLCGFLLLSAQIQAFFAPMSSGISRRIISNIVSLVTIGMPFLLFAIFIYSYFRRVEENRRAALRPILLTMFFSFGILIYFFVINKIVLNVLILQPNLLLPAMGIIAIPLSFGYSIFKYGLMDLSEVLRRGLVYTATTSSVAVGYVAIVFGSSYVLGNYIGIGAARDIVMAISLVIFGFVFEPLKNLVQKSVDRVFYAERVDYQRALLDLSQDLPRLINSEHIINVLAFRIQHIMHVDAVGLVTFRDGEIDRKIGLTVPKEMIDELLATHALRYVNAEHSSAFGNVALIIPMLVQSNIIGAIAVGYKISGQLFSQSDIDLLSTVAVQAAIALENSRLHEATLEREKMQRELELARTLQESLLPASVPRFEHLDIAGCSLPAEYVGGDYFDYFILSPTKILLAIGDVSGKGVAAALYMAKLQGMMQIAARMAHSPKEILEKLNYELYGTIDKRSYITLTLALFDIEAERVTIARAGHTKPLLFMENAVHEIHSIGLGLGLEKGLLFGKTLQEVEIPLKKGQIFLLYSDGLNEACNEQKDQFGISSISEILQDNASSESATILQNTLLRRLAEFIGKAEQHDDVTMICIRV